MRENQLTCDKINFISILEVKACKVVNEHATFFIKGHVAEGSDGYVMDDIVNQSVSLFAFDPTEGQKELFNGIISDIGMHTENDMSILSVTVVSRSALMDIELETRTFQDSAMTYENVTERMGDAFNFLWPKQGGENIDSMIVQYKETDWAFAKRLAGRLGTVVVPDYLLDEPYISIGMTTRPVQTGIDVISFEINKGTNNYRLCALGGELEELHSIEYVVKSRDIYDLCDGIVYMGQTLYVYAIDTVYEGNELMHYYTLKDKEGFYTRRTFNENLAGAALAGKIIDIQHDAVQVEVADDVEQMNHKWFPYATAFTQPDGFGWYFMPEEGDEIRLEFPSSSEHDAYVSSALHMTHGSRMDSDVKYIRTINEQVVQFCPERIIFDDGAGSSVILDKEEGISLKTSKIINVNAESHIILNATGKVEFAAEEGISVQKGNSTINVEDMIDISSQHTRVQ